MRNSTPLKRTDKGDAGSVQRLPQQHKKSWSQIWLDSIKRYYWLYIFVIPTLIFYLIFHYGPMGGLIIAFKRYTGAKSIWESPWVGLRWFQNFFKSTYSRKVITNSLAISFYSLSMFPLPIILALVFDEVRNKSYKRVAQTVMYAPHFISTVVLVSMLTDFVILLALENLPVEAVRIHWPMVLFPMVTMWYILTELGSIIENAIELGANVPEWLPKILNAAAHVVENAGEKVLEEAAENAGNLPEMKKE